MRNSKRWHLWFCCINFNPFLRTPLSFFRLFTMLNCLSGCLPNIARNSIVNCCELVTYDIIKELILTHNLMTGKCKHFKLIPRNFRHLMSSCYCSWLFNSAFFVFNRQHALSLHSGLRSRFLHHHHGVSGGRDKNTLHEFSAWAVQRCY